MRRRIFGLESEYGLTCMDKGNAVLSADALARHLFEDVAVFAMVPCLFLRPPPTTRVRLRGEFIRRARLRGSEYQVDWTFVRTIVEGQSETVFCPDPFVAHDEQVERLVA
jgi:hypothetical protein